jgi:hypothetical protein
MNTRASIALFFLTTALTVIAGVSEIVLAAGGDDADRRQPVPGKPFCIRYQRGVSAR